MCIAAAGRVLKTLQIHVETDIEDSVEIDRELVYSLELQGMEKAMHQINYTQGSRDMPFYCVGYSVTNYYLNGYVMKKLDGQKGSTIGADILSTFLPSEVVGSLYKVVEKAGLEVYSLTLEPIAAIEVAIPEKLPAPQYRACGYRSWNERYCNHIEREHCRLRDDTTGR